MRFGGEIHRGVTRTVLLAGRWAVKVPSLRAYGEGARGVLWSLTRGIQANLSERSCSMLSMRPGDLRSRSARS